jgi:hypothetical protein
VEESDSNPVAWNPVFSTVTPPHPSAVHACGFLVSLSKGIAMQSDTQK